MQSAVEQAILDNNLPENSLLLHTGVWPSSRVDIIVFIHKEAVRFFSGCSSDVSKSFIPPFVSRIHYSSSCLLLLPSSSCFCSPPESRARCFSASPLEKRYICGSQESRPIGAGPRGLPWSSSSLTHRFFTEVKFFSIYVALKGFPGSAGARFRMFQTVLGHSGKIFKVHGPCKGCEAGGLFSALWACSPKKALSFLDVR